MNADKLRRLQAQVRIGGKGTPRRKKKVMHQSAATDDKKLQSSLKKLSVSTIPGIEEVNIIKDDLTVIHFNNPKAQASLSANTFAITGHGETKKIVEMLPEILPQLGQDTVMQLRVFANTMSGNQKPSNIVPNPLANVAEEDDVPLLVNDFEEVAKKEETKAAKSKGDAKRTEEIYKKNENISLKEENITKQNDTSKDAAEKIDKKSKKQQNKQQQQSANGAVKIKSDVGKSENKQQKQMKQEKSNKQEKTQLTDDKGNAAENKVQTTIKSEVKLIKEPDVKKQEVCQQKQQVKAGQSQQKAEAAKLEKNQKLTKEETKKTNDKAQQKTIEKPSQQTDKPAEKKNEENLKDSQIQKGKKKDETSMPKDLKVEESKESKTQHAPKKEEEVKSTEVKDSQKIKKATEQNKEPDIRTKDQSKQSVTSKHQIVENKNEAVRIQQTGNEMQQQQKIPAVEEEEIQKRMNKNTELAATNDLNKVAVSKTENKQESKQTNIVGETSNSPISLEPRATIKTQDNQLPQAASKPKEQRQEIAEPNITTSKEIRDQKDAAFTFDEKPRTLVEVIKEDKSEEKNNQQQTACKITKQPDAEKSPEPKTITPSDKSKEQATFAAGQLNKQQSPKPGESKKITTSNQASPNNKKEESKVKPTTQPGVQTKHTKPSTPKPSLQIKSVTATKTPDKSTTTAKPETPTKAASPQPKTPTTPNKNISPSMATPPTTPNESTTTIAAPPADTKAISDGQKKPVTAPKPTQVKTSLQKPTNTNPTTATKPKQSSPVKNSPNTQAQQEQKKQPSPPKPENTKQPQSTLSTSQQQPLKQPSLSKQLAPAKQSTPTKQPSPAKQAPSTKTSTPLEQKHQLKATTSHSKDQPPKATTPTQLSPSKTQPPKGTSQVPTNKHKPATAQLDSQQPKVSTPQPGTSQPNSATPQLKETIPQPIASPSKVTTPQSIDEKQNESTVALSNERPKANNPLSAVDQQPLVLQPNATISPNQQSQVKGSTPKIAVERPTDITTQHQSNSENKTFNPQPPAPQLIEPKNPTNQNIAQAAVPQKEATTPHGTDVPQPPNVQQPIGPQNNP